MIHMKNYDDNDDPIQEVGKKNIFSRILIVYFLFSSIHLRAFTNAVNQGVISSLRRVDG